MKTIRSKERKEATQSSGGGPKILSFAKGRDDEFLMEEGYADTPEGNRKAIIAEITSALPRLEQDAVLRIVCACLRQALALEELSRMVGGVRSTFGSMMDSEDDDTEPGPYAPA
jgi:hypothetical protein